MGDGGTKKINEVSGDLWGNVESKGYSVKLFQDKSVLNTIKIKNGANLIGRMPENDIMIDDPEVSRSHARIFFDNKKDVLFIEDLQSENGIFVNGAKIEKTEISVGDEITVGDHKLSVIYADQFSVTPELEKQIQQADKQQWRLEQTMAAPTPQQQKEIMERIKKKPNPKDYGTAVVKTEVERQEIIERMKKPPVTEKIDTPSVGKNMISLTLGIGNERISKELEYDFVRDINTEKEQNLDDAIYINVKIGNKIFCKKIKF